MTFDFKVLIRVFMLNFTRELWHFPVRKNNKNSKVTSFIAGHNLECCFVQMSICLES